MPSFPLLGTLTSISFFKNIFLLSYPSSINHFSSVDQSINQSTTLSIRLTCRNRYLLCPGPPWPVRLLSALCSTPGSSITLVPLINQSLSPLLDPLSAPLWDSLVRTSDQLCLLCPLLLLASSEHFCTIAPLELEVAQVDHLLWK